MLVIWVCATPLVLWELGIWGIVLGSHIACSATSQERRVYSFHLAFAGVAKLRLWLVLW